MAITTNPQDQGLKKTKPNGQQEAYLVLSEEERAKGYVRPYRDKYVHTGRKVDGVEELPEPRKSQTGDGRVYVAKYVALRGEDGKTKGWGFLTADEYESHKRTGRIGGCGTETKMHKAIAETYARNPKFYSATYCVKCGTHKPLTEFEWQDGTIVGS